MCIFYPEAPEESRFMWCCGVVQRVKRRDEKMILADVKWDRGFIASGESKLTEEVLKKSLWNPEKPNKGAWRQDLREYKRKINK